MLNSPDDVLILMRMFRMIVYQFGRLLYLDIIQHIFERLGGVGLDTLCLSLLIDFVDVLVSVFVLMNYERNGQEREREDM